MKKQAIGPAEPTSVVWQVKEAVTVYVVGQVDDANYLDFNPQLLVVEVA